MRWDDWHFPVCELANWIELNRVFVHKRVQLYMILVAVVEYTHTHTHTFNNPFSGTTRVSRYQKGKTNLDFTEARDNEWQWHQLGHMQVCTSLQTNNHASTPPLIFYRPDALPAAQPTASKHLRCTVVEYTGSVYLPLRPKTNDVSDWSSNLTGKCNNFFFKLVILLIN